MKRRQFLQTSYATAIATALAIPGTAIASVDNWAKIEEPVYPTKITAPPKFYSPLHTPSNWQIPQNHIEKIFWNKYFRVNSPYGAAMLDILTHHVRENYSNIHPNIEEIAYEYFSIGYVHYCNEIEGVEVKGVLDPSELVLNNYQYINHEANFIYKNSHAITLENIISLSRRFDQFDNSNSTSFYCSSKSIFEPFISSKLYDVKKTIRERFQPYFIDKNNHNLKNRIKTECLVFKNQLEEQLKSSGWSMK